MMKSYPLFRADCLSATNNILSSKTDNVTSEMELIAVKYLLSELPIWFDSPYIFDISHITLAYKNLPEVFQRICYNYDMLKNTTIVSYQ